AGEQPTTVSFTFIYLPIVARKIRVVIAKPGLDGHDRGAKIIARALRDAGMEVIYTGLFQTPPMIAHAAADEDVDVVGLSILSGAHNALVPQIIDALRAAGMDDVLVVVGGTIPDADVPGLREAGVSAVFGPGTPLTEAVDFIREHAPVREGAA
ncbi:MAG TPA: cobalamin B12-binding domain-containing protein, partial [Thermomicrobiaceae bacterium]|nr:cobalamin B12-binding domain-containing protein [Thermomicrobiaceae bacterium]